MGHQDPENEHDPEMLAPLDFSANMAHQATIQAAPMDAITAIGKKQRNRSNRWETDFGIRSSELLSQLNFSG